MGNRALFAEISHAQSSELWVSLGTRLVKNLPAMWETWVWSLGWEDPLEKGTTTRYSVLTWTIPCSVWSMRLQSVHRTERFCSHFHCSPVASTPAEGGQSPCVASRENDDMHFTPLSWTVPLQCSCLWNPRDGGACWAAVYGVAQSRTWLKWRSSSSSPGLRPAGGTVARRFWTLVTSQENFQDIHKPLQSPYRPCRVLRMAVNRGPGSLCCLLKTSAQPKSCQGFCSDTLLSTVGGR